MFERAPLGHRILILEPQALNTYFPVWWTVFRSKCGKGRMMRIDLAYTSFLLII